MVVNREAVARLIRRRREAKGWTQEQLAEHLGIRRETIIQWEKNVSPPNRDSRRKLARVLGGEPDEYEWTREDEERRDELAQHRLDRNTILRMADDDLAELVRRLRAGEI